MTDHCKGCGQAKPAGRAAPGWKRAGDWYCPACFARAFMARAVALPVAGPAEGDWGPVGEALAAAWGESTALANWGMLTLAKADVSRTPGMTKLPPMPAVNLYTLGIARGGYEGRAAWAGAAGSASSVLRAVQKRYQRDRLAVVWHRSQALPLYRYPFPYPVRRQEWSASVEGPRGHLLLSVTLPGARLRLRLRGGPEFGRQVDAFRKVARGEVLAGEVSLYRQRAEGDCHRRTLEDRTPGGGRRCHYREMAKVVAWLPRPDPNRHEDVMLLRTDPAAFWVAELRGRAERPWVLNADHVSGWVKAHDAYRQRMSEDLKYEKRWPKRKRLQMREALELRCLKQHRRLDSWCKEAAALLAGYARRRKCGAVVYDDSCRDYLPRFPWHRLAVSLGNKLDEDGIALVTGAGGGEGEEDAEGACVEEVVG